MTKSTDTRNLRLLIIDVYNSKDEPIPDGFDFYLTGKIKEYIDAVYEQKETPLSARERLTAAMEKGALRSATLDSIANALKINLKINLSEEFIEFAYNRSKHGEDAETFCKYWLANGGEPTYWSEKRMKLLWPQAFTQELSFDEQLAKEGYK